MLKKLLYSIVFFINIFFIVPSYSQNIVNNSLSIQEMQNGIKLFNERRYAAAIQSFELSLSYESLNHTSKYYQGLSYLYAGYTQSAIRIWEDLVKAGVADHQVIEQLNNLYYKISLDEGYDQDIPYIFREYYDGFVQGGHDLYRTSFIEYDPVQDLKYISSVGSKQVVVLDTANNIVNKYGARLFLPSLLQMPMGLALYSNQLYVADYKKNQVVIFDQQFLGGIKFAFGEMGSLPHQLSGPMGLTISSDEYIYVVDNGNHRIQKFKLDGTHVYGFGANYLYRPTDIIVTADKVYVTDIGINKKGKVVVFDTSGNFITNIGEEFLQQPRGLSLNQNTLFISDSAGFVYTYNTQNHTTKLFEKDDKLLAPFDMIQDKDNKIWRTDFNSEKLAIYVPLQSVYGNIILETPQVITDNYPYIYAVTRVRNKDGSPITGLTREELILTEFDQQVSNILVSGTDQHRNKMKLSIIVDRSLKSQEYTAQLEYYLKTFLSNTTGNDLINTILIDDTAHESGFNTASVSQTWNYITNYQPKSPIPAVVDVPIYNSITSLLNNLRNRAVIVFTSGEGYQEAFSSYGLDVVKTYADQNSIPIYVINFGTKNAEFWTNIAKNSYGQYYQANTNAREILNLYNVIKNSPPLEYLIEYDAHNYSKFPGLWIDTVLSVERFGLSGVVKSGYYVPKPLNSTVNLWNNFFPNPLLGGEKSE